MRGGYGVGGVPRLRTPAQVVVVTADVDGESVSQRRSAAAERRRERCGSAERGGEERRCGSGRVVERERVRQAASKAVREWVERAREMD